MVTVILKVVEMTLLKYPTWGESFPKTIYMLTMITNEQQIMPYYLSDEIASKPYNRNPSINMSVIFFRRKFVLVKSLIAE
jgi:hypothetical protein